VLVEVVGEQNEQAALEGELDRAHLGKPLTSDGSTCWVEPVVPQHQREFGVRRRAPWRSTVSHYPLVDHAMSIAGH
jgi:hypothetical protein